jgi:sigma-B regulation protein RsbU (phosphoserine phosphatase)
MTKGLLERDRIRIGLELAQEVQQSLLPRIVPQVPGLEIGISSEYCDETGGDYFDFIQFREKRNDVLGIVLGDVSGHGISSALLMATARAFFRQRALQGGDLDVVLNDVNSLLVDDIAETGQFMTMFYLVIDTTKGILKWVRAGHDPGCLYDPGRDAYTELKGAGIPLGIQADWLFELQQFNGFSKGQVIVLGTDGIWETRNVQGEYFGKARLEELVRMNARRSAQEIIDAVMAAHKAFRLDRSPDDDITLLIIKAV